MTKRDLLVVGASAGGVEALTRFCSLLPKSFDAAVLITLHVAPNSHSHLPQILERAGHLPVTHAKHGGIIQNGHIYVAPPSKHLYVRDHALKLSTGPRVNGARPAIDVLFHSAANVYGPRTIGVILSGMLSDGVDGLLAIKMAGGAALVQDPQEAAFTSMPEVAIQKVPVDHILPIEQLVSKIVELTQQEISEKQPESGVFPMIEGNDPQEKDLLEDRKLFEKDEDVSPRTLLVCPDCGGVLWEARKNGHVHYRCQIGHRYSEESLVQLQGNNLENALWTAVRALEERSLLARRMASRLQGKNAVRSERQFERMAREADETREIIRKLLESGSLIHLISNVQDISEDENIFSQKDDVSEG
jgi:two-component system, chemotaxis family, protein-glutamate methylesterase/glutaminase